MSSDWSLYLHGGGCALHVVLGVLCLGGGTQHAQLARSQRRHLCVCARARVRQRVFARAGQGLGGLSGAYKHISSTLDMSVAEICFFAPPNPPNVGKGEKAAQKNRHDPSRDFTKLAHFHNIARNLLTFIRSMSWRWPSMTT